MVELTVALIVIMMLLAGLIQIGQITGAHTRTMIAARAEAAEGAMAETYSQPLDTRYVFAWMEGPDHKRYTRDDVPFIATNTVDDTRTIVAMARPDELKTCVPNNALSTLGVSADTMDEFFLVHGYNSESCPTLPVIRSLAYGRESISVESDVWLVWTEEIY